GTGHHDLVVETLDHAEAPGADLGRGLRRGHVHPTGPVDYVGPRLPGDLQYGIVVPGILLERDRSLETDEHLEQRESARGSVLGGAKHTRDRIHLMDAAGGDLGNDEARTLRSGRAHDALQGIRWVSFGRMPTFAS